MPDQPIVLSPAQARVLGSLIEKEVTTPDYYPLSMNALLNACNQRSNREPVMDLDEDEARLALRGLEELRLAGRARNADSRVTKYEHWLGEAFNFSRAETALVCVLLLRGPQTPGELRSRTERMHRFEELTDVTAGLDKLIQRDPPLAVLLPRQPGSRESRYAHLLSGPVDAAAVAAAYGSAPAAWSGPSSSGQPGFEPSSPEHEPRIAQLEATVAELKREVAALKQRFEDLYA